jgi:hypothetical protein
VSAKLLADRMISGMGGKWLEVLKEVAPGTNVAAIILSSASRVGAAISRAAEAVAPALGVRLTMSPARDGTEIERAIQDFAQHSNGGSTNRHFRVGFAARQQKEKPRSDFATGVSTWRVEVTLRPSRSPEA